MIGFWYSACDVTVSYFIPLTIGKSRDVYVAGADPEGRGWVLGGGGGGLRGSSPQTSERGEKRCAQARGILTFFLLSLSMKNAHTLL